MDDIAIAVEEVVDGRLSFGAPACRTSILAVGKRCCRCLLTIPPAPQPREEPSLKVTELLDIPLLPTANCDYGVTTGGLRGLSAQQHGIARLLHQHLGRWSKRLPTTGQSAPDDTSESSKQWNNSYAKVD